MRNCIYVQTVKLSFSGHSFTSNTISTGGSILEKSIPKPTVAAITGVATTVCLVFIPTFSLLVVGNKLGLSNSAKNIPIDSFSFGICSNKVAGSFIEATASFVHYTREIT